MISAKQTVLHLFRLGATLCMPDRLYASSSVRGNDCWVMAFLAEALLIYLLRSL